MRAASRALLLPGGEGLLLIGRVPDRNSLWPADHLPVIRAYIQLLLSRAFPSINLVKNKDSQPPADYRNLVDCAKNKEAVRMPLYEHNVSFEKIGEIMNADMMQ